MNYPEIHESFSPSKVPANTNTMLCPPVYTRFEGMCANNRYGDTRGSRMLEAAAQMSATTCMYVSMHVYII